MGSGASSSAGSNTSSPAALRPPGTGATGVADSGNLITSYASIGSGRRRSGLLSDVTESGVVSSLSPVLSYHALGDDEEIITPAPTSANAYALNHPYVVRRSETLNTVQVDDGGANMTASGLGAMNVPAVGCRYTSNNDDKDNDAGDSPSYIHDMPPNSSHYQPTQNFNATSPNHLSFLSSTETSKPHSIVTRPPIDSVPVPVHCLNPASDINARLDTQVEVKVYPCNNNTAGSGGKKKFTQFTVKPEGVIIQGTNRHRSISNDLGSEYATHIGRKLQRYELSDTRACQLLVTTHNKSFFVVPAPEAFSRHSGTCRLLGDRKHPLAPHTLQVGDFLRVGSVGVVVIETHNGVENRILSEEKIQKIMKDTTSGNGGFLDLGETDGENSDDSLPGLGTSMRRPQMSNGEENDEPVCYMCFDDENTAENPLITPCKCRGDTRYVHVGCLRKWHTAEADNQVCFLSSVDATCSVCKSTFKSDFKLRDGRLVKLFKSSLEPPYVSLLVATKHEMAQRLFNTRFQLSFSTLLKPDGRNGARPLLLGRSSGSDMVLDYRTVSARHATIRFKNGEFVFTDASSSNGSYLYLRRPVELTASQPVQFRLGRSMISMKVVNKWNRRLLRAVRRTGYSSSGLLRESDDHSVGSNDDDVRISDGMTGNMTRSVPRRSRESIVQALPAPGMLSQNSHQHLDLLYALAYPKRNTGERKDSYTRRPVEIVDDESKAEENDFDADEPIVEDGTIVCFVDPGGMENTRRQTTDCTTDVDVVSVT